MEYKKIRGGSKVKALFVRKVFDLEQLKSITEEVIKLGYEGSGYEVIREKELTKEEFEEFSSNFLKDQNWINETDGGPNDIGQERCVRVFCKEKDETILVNSEGYLYPRYVALEF